MQGIAGAVNVTEAWSRLARTFIRSDPKLRTQITGSPLPARYSSIAPSPSNYKGTYTISLIKLVRPLKRRGSSTLASISVNDIKSYQPHPTIAYHEGSKLALHKVNSTATSIRLEIVHHLSVNVGPRSKTVIAQLIEGDLQRHTDGATVPVGSTVVAKFYDPEYVGEEGPWSPGENGELCAESKRNEVKAYNLLGRMQGHDIPIFYGEYSYARPQAHNSPGVTNSIGVILMEHVTDPVLCIIKVPPAM